MEIRKLVVALIAIGNFAVETLEKLVSEDGDAQPEKEEKPSRSRSKPETVKPKTTSKNGKPAKDDDEENDDDDAGDEPSEDDVIDAVRGAQKVLEGADVKKILKKYGRAERASEVEPEHRQAVIDALEKAIEDAE